MGEFIISDVKNFEETKKKILQQGKEKFHILADFDRTLTKANVKGVKAPSIIAELRSGNYINEDYAKQANALADKYHAIEMDFSVPFGQKKKSMYEWWSKHFNLLIKSGLNKNHLEQIVDSGKIQLRKGAREFLDFLHIHKIPLVILSSAGLGGDSIKMFLEKQERLYDNIYVIANIFEWDKKGRAIGFKEPIITVANKDETIIYDYPDIYEKIKNRKNVLLLGDSLGDVGMVKGFDYDNLIKIGFLNDKVEENLEIYKDNFDVVLLNDSDLGFVNGFLKEFTEN